MNVDMRPYSNLSAAIISMAEQDYKKPRYKSDVFLFLKSYWFLTLCQSISQQPERTRRAVEEGWGLSYRTAYRLKARGGIL